MSELAKVAPAFIEMAHKIVWATAGTVDAKGRPRARVLHPIWEWNGNEIVGWIATNPTPFKRAHLKASPNMSLNYWAPDQDTCVAECRASWEFDDATRTRVWDLFKDAPAPVGYDPAMIPTFVGPTDEGFAALRLDPWKLRVFPGTMLLEGKGEVLTWNG